MINLVQISASLSSHIIYHSCISLTLQGKVSVYNLAICVCVFWSLFIGIYINIPICLQSEEWVLMVKFYLEIIAIFYHNNMWFLYF